MGCGFVAFSCIHCAVTYMVHVQVPNCVGGMWGGAETNEGRHAHNIVSKYNVHVHVYI